MKKVWSEKNGNFSSNIKYDDSNMENQQLYKTNLKRQHTTIL